MNWRRWTALLATLGGVAFLVPLLASQPAQPPGPEGQPPPPFGRGGPPGPGGFMGQQRKLIPQFDKDGDGRLNTAERQAAREFLKKDRTAGGRGFGPGGRGF